jgi:hypothetical protein
MGYAIKYIDMSCYFFLDKKGNQKIKTVTTKPKIIP